MSKLPSSAFKILNAIAQNKAELDQGTNMDQMSVLTGIAGGSTIRKGMAALKRLNLVIVEAKVAHATAKGMDQADLSAVAERPKTNEEHHEKIKTSRKLKPKEVDLFDALSDGRVHSKEDIRNALGVKGESTFRKLTGALKKHGILEYHGKSIQLTTAMFPLAPRSE